jgi:hypothetical protein
VEVPKTDAPFCSFFHAYLTEGDEMNLSKSIGSAVAGLLVNAVCWGELTIPNGTKISTRLEQTISSATAEEGQQVQLSVTENVKVGDMVVIPQGSPVLGTIVMAQEKRRMGRTGKLDFSIDKVRVADGEFVPLRYTMQKREGGSKGVSTGVMTAGAAVLFWPAAPFFLLRKGKDVNINKGIVLEVFTDQDHILKGTKGASTPVLSAVPASPPATVAAAGEPSIVSITSDVPGAEIEIDGAFVGSTPSMNKLTAGTHKITVKHGTSVWSRDLNVQPGGNVNVNALLQDSGPARATSVSYEQRTTRSRTN